MTINLALYHPTINQYLIDIDQKKFNPQRIVFSESDINTILKLVYSKKMEGFQRYDSCDGINIAYSKAIHDNELGYFNYKNNYLDNLFDYVKVKLFFKYSYNEINIKVTKTKIDSKVDEVIKIFGYGGIFDLIGINKSEFINALKESIKYDLQDKNSLIISSNYICDVFEEIIFTN